MSELTNERLEEYAQDGWDAASTDVETMARELLALRSLRDARDEEVQKLFSQIWGALTPAGAMLAEKLRDIAITRGQQLREAREECEGLQGYITVLNGGGPPNE